MRLVIHHLAKQIENLLHNFSSVRLAIHLSCLPAFWVTCFFALQSSHDELHEKFLVEKAALEAKYLALYAPLYAKVTAQKVFEAKQKKVSLIAVTSPYMHHFTQRYQRIIPRSLHVQLHAVRAPSLDFLVLQRQHVMLVLCFFQGSKVESHG